MLPLVNRLLSFQGLLKELSLKNAIYIWPSNSLLGIYLKNTEILIQKDIHPCVYCSIMYNSHDWKQHRCLLIDEWIKNMWYIHIHIYIHGGILLSNKKEWNLTICSNMNGPRGYCASEISQRKTYYMIHLYVES